MFSKRLPEMDSRRPNSGLPVSTDIHSSGNGVEVANTENPYFQLPIRQRVSISESSDQDAAWKESSDLGPTFTATMDESDSDASRTVFTPEAGLSEEEETEPDNVEAKVPGSTSSVSWMQQRDFYEAIERGDVEAVRVFLTEGCTVDRKTDNGYTPLVIAILEGQLEVAELLLGNYASAHQRVNKLPPIVHAVIKPNIPLQCIQLLLNYGAILTTPFGPYYYNALHWAISNGNVDAVDLLVCRGMDMEETCDGGRTALQVAAKFGMTTIAKLLLAKGANINHRSHNGNTALIWAAYHGHAETVQLLVNEGMDVNDCNGADVSSLWIASSFGHTEVVEILLRNGADIDLPSCESQNFTPIMAAAISGHANVVQALVDHGSDLTVVNGNGNTVLKSALDQGRPHIVYILLKALGGPDYPQDSLALNMAMAKSTEDVKSLMTSAGLSQPTCSSDDATRRFMYSDIIDEILHKGGDVIQPHALSAMMDAALHEGGSIMVASLLSHGFGPSQFLSNGKTPIHVAVAWEDFALVELLLERSADPSIMSRNLEGQKYTPLDQALFNFNSHEMKDTLIIDSLLATRKCKLMAGPDIHSTAFSYVLSHYTTWPNDAGMTMTSTMLAYAEDIHADRSDDGSTLLHAAIYHGRTDIIDVLLCKGANINAADHLGRTPFYLECQRSTRLFRFLLNRTADPHVKGPDGQSSLHVAAGAGKPEIINFLLTLDLDINIEDANGYTPLSWALILGQENAVLHLLYRAAKLPTKKFRRGRTMLHVAASLGMLRFTKLLLANKSVELDVNAKDDMGWTPLALACRKGTKELVSALLNAGAETEASPRNTEDRPLHLALRAGNVDVAEILLTHGADVTVRGEQGQTPLHLAAQLTNSHTIQLLLIHNPEISALDALGRIPLSLCTNLDTANILIGSGAAVNHVDNQGWTPSHFAVESENLEMFRVLVRNEADVDARTLDDGMSVTERIEWVEDEDVRWEMEEILRDET